VKGLPAKLLELAREIIPGARRIGLVDDVTDPKALPQRREIETAGRALELEISTLEVRTADDIGSAFEALAREHVEIVIVEQSNILFNARKQIAKSAMAKKLPSVYGYHEHVQAGGLASYGVDLPWCFHRAAYYVDKILKGAKPADLPEICGWSWGGKFGAIAFALCDEKGNAQAAWSTASAGTPELIDAMVDEMKTALFESLDEQRLQFGVTTGQNLDVLAINSLLVDYGGILLIETHQPTPLPERNVCGSVEGLPGIYRIQIYLEKFLVLPPHLHRWTSREAPGENNFLMYADYAHVLDK
jgi:ABC transporter substrate binding protein